MLASPVFEVNYGRESSNVQAGRAYDSGLLDPAEEGVSIERESCQTDRVAAKVQVSYFKLDSLNHRLVDDTCDVEQLIPAGPEHQ